MNTDEAKILTGECLEMALGAGADKARASFARNAMSIVATLDGSVDKVTSCLDCSISLNIFADGRYGSFSTNKLERGALRSFIAKAVETTRMMAPDPARDLPDPARTVKDAITGNELGICDPEWRSVTPEQRIAAALENSIGSACGKGWKLVSSEGEYSDSESVSFVADTNGTEALHLETSFEFFTELTIQDARGHKYSGGWWDAAPLRKDFHPGDVSSKALDEAVMQIGPRRCRSGRYRAVVDSEVSSKLMNPVLNALNAFSIQQKNSFMEGTLGKQVFPAGFDIMDLPRIKGEACGRLFDTEGVATTNHHIIKDGVVQEYFVNTYMANKLGITPTVEDATRPFIPPFAVSRPQSKIMDICGDGILITDFCGGNCNSATGDFSYAIQGYRFKNGCIVHPVREMLITGNMLGLWSRLIAAGADARRCREKLTPTLAFDAVDFSG